MEYVYLINTNNENHTFETMEDAFYFVLDANAKNNHFLFIAEKSASFTHLTFLSLHYHLSNYKKTKVWNEKTGQIFEIEKLKIK